MSSDKPDKDEIEQGDDYDMFVSMGQSNATRAGWYNDAYEKAMQGDPLSADYVLAQVMEDSETFAEFCENWAGMPAEIQEAYQKHLDQQKEAESPEEAVTGDQDDQEDA